MQTNITTSLPIRAIQEAWSCWMAELRSMKFWCGAAVAFVLPAAATLVVIYFPAVGAGAITIKFILLFSLMLLPACRAISDTFKKLGDEFVDGIPKMFLANLLPTNLSRVLAVSESFSTRTIAPPKSPPRLTLA